MLKIIRQSKAAKAISCFLGISFLAEIANPVKIFALTSGPGQPEMQSFSPAGTEDMVDLFTGNFHYNIDLMEVPGPNGSYPINISYNAGVSMDQEASWVGLGWNINPGMVNRNMRGIPDDFDGDKIKKEFNTKPNVTIGLGLDGIDLEAFGIPALSLNLSGQIYYNTYHGLGLKTGAGIGFLLNDQIGGGLSGDLSLSWDSQSGVDISPCLSFTGKNNKQDMQQFGGGSSSAIGVSYNSRQGTMNLWMKPISNISAGKVFGKASTVPFISMPSTAYSIKGLVKLGPSAGAFANAKISANLTKQWTENYLEVPAYGLIYAHHASDNSLKDINREKEHIINKHSNNLPVPILTHDVYSAQGQGVNGTFRAFRPDIGILGDMAISSESGDGQLGIDLGTLGMANHLGLNIAVNYAGSYSGMWKDGNEDLKNNYTGFLQSPPSNVDKALYESFYFKMTEENSGDTPEQFNAIQGSSPASFSTQIESKRPVALNRLNDIFLNNAVRKERSKRKEMIWYKTRKELGLSGYMQNHIAEISVINSDGIRYTYGIPAYNTRQKEVCFAVQNDGPVSQKTVAFNQTDASVNNNNGSDHYYSSTEVPPYAHSYLLTSVTSPDYVDIDCNGPSDIDFGHWVRMDYTKLFDNYKWRIPYKDANYSKNYISDSQDNKGSYTYGEKEVWMLDSIFTKTHVAVFYKSSRNDALEPYDEYLSNPSFPRRPLEKLDSIALFARSDRATPIKTVHFAYSYELCRKAENGDGINGKLTLKQLWFTYKKNRKGRYNKYEFAYNNVNPDYSILQADKWGNYSSVNNLAVWPYVSHHRDGIAGINAAAGAWNLSKIYLPSGAVISVEYESDDYAYVQNKRAAEMVRIVGIGNPEGSGMTSPEDLKIFFQLDNPTTDDLYEYIQGLKDNLVYFKVFEKLMNYRNPQDYVEGYAEIETSQGSYGKWVNGSDTLGYVTFKSMDMGPVSGVHPFRAAGWQYLKVSRPDLLYPALSTDGAFTQMANIVFGLFSEMSSFFGGYYRFCNTAGYCNHFIQSEEYPSAIRLNSPSMSRPGGGHRVKKITITDDWQIPDESSYSQNYIYKTFENGKMISSGVAEYEPMIGGEENPLHFPVRYNNEKSFLNKNEELYLEEPFGESYFPAPEVGYSTVLVYNSHGPTEVSSGIQLAEFYTAKDFPVHTSRTEVNKPAYDPFEINIPFIGYKSFTSHGYSQGYAVELNNMHGKQKSISTYSLVDGQQPEEVLLPGFVQLPVSKTEYIYKTIHPYNPAGDNQLDNYVTVLTSDGHYHEAILGLNYDFFTDMRESSTDTYSGDILPNIDQMAWLVVPMAWLMIQQSGTLFRTIVTNKITYRNGILSEIRKLENGTLKSTKNLMFDPETGHPLLTISTSDYSNTGDADIYNNPVYNYNLPAHWYYGNMGGAFKNYRANFTLANAYDTSGTLANAGKYCTMGDIVTDESGQKHWITSINNNELIGFQPPLNNHTPHEEKFTNISSGYTNQQDVSCGYITSLTNPMQRKFPLFEAINNHIFREKESFPGQDTLTYFDYCSGYRTICISVYPSVENNRTVTHIDFTQIPDGSCYHEVADACKLCNNLCFAKIVTTASIDDVHDLNNYNFSMINDEYVVVKLKINNHVRDRHALWFNDAKCFQSCAEVLTAGATEYCDTCWHYDYKETGLSSSDISTLLSYNPYKAGQKGIFRPKRENTFYINRKISNSGIESDDNTNIAKDGYYERFCDFDHYLGNDFNIQSPWTWISRATQYNPCGFETENVNASGIYTSALYGYNSSLAVAVTNNSRNFETAFESFEDYPFVNNRPYYSTTNKRIKSNSRNNVLTSSDAHTGSYCLKDDQFTVTIPVSPSQEIFHLIPGKKYLFTAWAKKTTQNGNIYPFTVNHTSFQGIAPINGWYRLEYVFYAPASGNYILDIGNAGPAFLIDDIRIQPFDALMKTWVYDPKSLKPLAEMDENHYATFYNYDEEGTLVQVKKETIKGVMTIKKWRQNIRMK